MKVIDIKDHMPEPDLPPQLKEVIDLTRAAFQKHHRPIMIVTETANGDLYPIFPNSVSQSYGMLMLLDRMMNEHDYDYD